MDKFFRHKTLNCSPSLSKCGEMRSGIKSELVKCSEMLPTGLLGTEAPRQLWKEVY